MVGFVTFFYRLTPFFQLFRNKIFKKSVYYVNASFSYNSLNSPVFLIFDR